MRTIAITLAACLAVLATGATAAEKTIGRLSTDAAVLSGGNVLATSGAAINAANQAAPVLGGYSPLTAAECKGLGGKVVPNTGCSLNFGTDSCVTVGSDGVVHKVCLSK